MKPALIILTSLSDLAGAACLAALTALLWQSPKKSRRRIAVTSAVFVLVSFAVSAWAVLRYPPEVFSGAFTDADPHYDAYLLYTALQGLAGGAIALSFPFLVLRVERPRRTLLTLFTAYMIEQSSFGLVSTLLRLDADSPKKLLAEAVYGAVVFGALTALFVFGTARTAEVPLRGVQEAIPGWIYPLMAVFSFAVYAKDSLFDGGMDPETAGRVYDTLWIVSTVGVAVTVGYFIYRVFALTGKQNGIRRQLEEQKEKYERAIQDEEELRIFRHDYKNHMLAVAYFLNEGKIKEAEAYLDTLKLTHTVSRKKFNTGNLVADAILNIKNDLAEEFETHLEFEGRIPPAGIENYDLNTVFANLTDNALEGARKVHGVRFVHIEAAVRNGFLSLSFVNPVDAPVEIRKNRIKTTKADPRSHGIGLKNVERTVKAYGGHLILSCTEDRFTADVMMKLRPHEPEP